LLSPTIGDWKVRKVLNFTQIHPPVLESSHSDGRMTGRTDRHGQSCMPLFHEHCANNAWNILKTTFTGTWAQNSYSVLWFLFLESPLRNEQFWSRWCSIMLLFQATGNAVTGTRTQDNIPEFWPCCALFVVSEH
jgi:hypothetical protein